jgi:integrase/recombinase XerD
MDEIRTVGQAIEACSGGGNLSPATRRAYHWGMTVFVKYLEKHGIRLDDPLDRLAMAVFIPYPFYVGERKGRASTNVILLRSASRLLQFLIVAGHIDPTLREVSRFDEAKAMVIGKKHKYEPREVSEDDVVKMIAAAQLIKEEEPWRSRDIAMVLTLASSGLRNFELCALRCRDIAWNPVHKKPFIHVEHGKGDKADDVPFSEAAYRAVLEYWKVRGWKAPDDPAFARHRKGGKKHVGIGTATVRRVVEQVRGLAGVEGEFTPHYFRHGIATMIVNRTGNIRLAKDQLRHARIETTDAYSHPDKRLLVDKHTEIFEFMDDEDDTSSNQ